MGVEQNLTLLIFVNSQVIKKVQSVYNNEQKLPNFLNCCFIKFASILVINPKPLQIFQRLYITLNVVFCGIQNSILQLSTT